MTITVRPGTVTVFTNVVCGWSTVAGHPLPEDVALPTSYLNDVRIDLRRGKADGA